MIDLYLTKYIEDRFTSEGKLIKGTRKPKGQDEVRRTLYSDPVKIWENIVAIDISRQDVIDLIMSIVERGANVQAGNALRELNAAYEFTIGLAKNSLTMAKIKFTSKKGQRVLSEQELKQFLEWLPTSKLPEKAKQIFILTN